MASPSATANNAKAAVMFFIVLSFMTLRPIISVISRRCRAIGSAPLPRTRQLISLQLTL